MKRLSPFAYVSQTEAYDGWRVCAQSACYRPLRLAPLERFDPEVWAFAGEGVGLEGRDTPTFELAGAVLSVSVVLGALLIVLETPFESPARRTPEVRCGGVDTFVGLSDPENGTTTTTAGTGSRT